MAKNDIRVREGHTLSVPVREYQTEASATPIYTGEPVKLKVDGSNYVIPLADNEPAIGTTTQVIGVAASDSTQTPAADGKVRVYVDDGSIEWECKVTTPANFDTQSKIDALANDRIFLDLISTIYTVDENAGDGAINGIQLIGGDPARKVAYFKFRPAALEGPVA
jgi:hypothetical protein